MARGTVSRREAVKNALLTNAIAVLLCAAVVGVFLLWPARSAEGSATATTRVGWEDLRAEAAERAAAAEANNAGAADPGAAVFMDGIVSSLGSVGGVVEAEAPPPEGEGPETTDEGGPVEGGPAGPAGSVVRYLGRVGAGTDAWGYFAVGTTPAFVRRGATQSVPVGVEGAERPDGVIALEVVEVAADEAVVREDGVERRVPKAARPDRVISVSSGQAGGTTPAPAAAANAGAKPKVASAAKRPNVEDFRKSDGTIDRESYVSAVRDFAASTRVQSTGGGGTGEQAGVPRRPGQRGGRGGGPEPGENDQRLRDER